MHLALRRTKRHSFRHLYLSVGAKKARWALIGQSKEFVVENIWQELFYSQSHRLWIVLLFLLMRSPILYECISRVPTCSLLSLTTLLSQFSLSGILQWARSVRFHHLGLQVGTGAQIACSQVDGRLCLRYRLLLGSLCSTIVGLQPSHLLSLFHFEHAILWWSHLQDKVRKSMSYLLLKNWESSCILRQSFVLTYIFELLLSFCLTGTFCGCTGSLKLFDFALYVMDLRSDVLNHLAL